MGELGQIRMLNAVQFEQGWAEFLAACAGGDLLKAEEMIRGKIGDQMRLTRLHSPDVTGRDSAQDSLLCTLLHALHAGCYCSDKYRCLQV